MKLTIQTQPCVKLSNPCCISSVASQAQFQFKPFAFHSHLQSLVGLSCTKQQCLRQEKRCFGVLRALAADTDGSSDGGERWLLEPVGDGDSRHIGYKVPMPSAFEIASSVVTVGRVPEKADVVIPVATVSAQHARFEKKGGDLLVTDLNSTNGTFIDEKRLSPGVTATVPPGRYITFGDTNLAIFRVSKLENAKASDESGEPKLELQIEGSSNTLEGTG